MKEKFLAIIFAIAAFTAFTSSASAQRNVTPAIDRDPVLEADAKHNLDVARQAFTPLKKAYKQVLLRFEETYAAYPEFSQIDEFIYIAGMSSYYLAQNKGKQKVDPKSEKEFQGADRDYAASNPRSTNKLRRFRHSQSKKFGYALRSDR